MKLSQKIALATAVCSAFVLSSANASLTAFQTFTGNYGYSASGFGSTSQSGTISAEVPIGSTVAAAYLYTSTYSSFAGAGGTFNGSTLSYTRLGSPSSTSQLEAGRADVTAIVKAAIEGGPGGIYNFDVTETSGNQDGEALVVIYRNALLGTSTVSVLDGYSANSGDTTTVNFATALDPSAPGFFANLALGIGFSCCSQASSVTVNGTTITNNAGNDDDGQTANGGLITVGGYNDPFSPFMPSYDNDHERYNIAPYVRAGDRSIVINTLNPSGDDNIFLAIVSTSGTATINQTADVPEPASLALIGLGLAGVLRSRRRSRA